MIGAVDWPLLLLVACLFAITGQLNGSGIAARVLAFLDDHGLVPNNLAVLLPFSVVTSNAIGSVPSAMLLLQIWPNPPPGVLYGLALLSTLAGNLLLSGSLTNLLIAEHADRMGAPLSFATMPGPVFRSRSSRSPSRRSAVAAWHPAAAAAHTSTVAVAGPIPLRRVAYTNRRYQRLVMPGLNRGSGRNASGGGHPSAKERAG